MPMPIHPLRSAVIALSLVVLVGTRSAAAQARTPFDPPRETALGSSPVTIPLVKIGDFYFVDLTVNGRPFRFTIETGAGFSAVSRRLAQALGLRVDSVEVMPGSRDGVVVLDAVAMGQGVFRGITARVVSMFDGQGFDGIVSLPILREILATLDFGRSEMRLERGSLPPANGRDIVEIVRQDRGGRLDVMMDVAGVRVPAVLDSRSFLWIVVPDSLEPRLRLDGQPRDIGQARGPSLGSFTLRGARLQGNASIGSAVFATPPVVLRNRPGVVLGAPLMERFAITLDQRSNRIRFTPGSSGPIVVSPTQWEIAGGPATQAVGQAPPPAAPGQRTMGFNLGGFPPRLRVLNIVPGSGASESGLKTDDQLVEFDGTPVESMSPGIFRAAAQRDRPVTVVVTRDGKRLTFEITPYTTP